MILEQSCLNIDKTVLNNAFQELITYQIQYADPGCAWGYFPERVDENDYPASKQLEKKILTSFVFEGYRFCFISASQGKVEAQFGGLHLDTLDDLGEKEELVRVIINLSQYPRYLKFSRLNRLALKNHNIFLSKHFYQHLDFLEREPSFMVTIPSMYHLIFLSSIWPHVGITNNEGHFLAAFDKKITKVHRKGQI